jgi:small subunit ribosomal protein S16
MVIIRLSRFGRKKAPFYRVVVADSRNKAVGKVIDYLGTWNPSSKVKQIDQSKVDEWVKKGARISPTVKKLLEK